VCVDGRAGGSGGGQSDGGGCLSSGGQSLQHHAGSSSNGGGAGSKTKKTRKARTAFTDHQLNTLEQSFERQKYLSVQDRMELASKLNLSDTQVKTWYQNRRCEHTDTTSDSSTWRGGCLGTRVAYRCTTNSDHINTVMINSTRRQAG